MCRINRFVILTLCCAMISGYNIDTNYSIVYSDDVLCKRNNRSCRTVNETYFGYSVLLHREYARNVSWVIIGAPRGDYVKMGNNSDNFNRPGVVYQCAFNGDCNYILPSETENERGHVVQVHLDTIVRKNNGWFGSAMAVDKRSDILTICAPRTIISFLNPQTEQYYNTMQGVCYNGTFAGKVYLEEKNLPFYDFSTQFWYNPMHGFSVHYPELHMQQNTGARIIGEPIHEIYGTLDIHYGAERIFFNSSIYDELSKFGFSLTSGYYFNRDQLLYVSGAPGWHYVGLVHVIDINTYPIFAVKLRGDTIGEFFGASLATGDWNDDGYDDLIVGAPHWGQDNGRVYVYFGSPKGFHRAYVTLDGTVEEAQFGHAIACGDIDRDGIDDIIIGAPWEDSGAIYVYNGDSIVIDANKLQPSQHITAKRMFEGSSGASINVERFGFSISQPVDVDINGYPDIAVGAYKSQHVVLLFSKQVVKTNINIFTIPTTLQRNASDFVIKTCVDHIEHHVRKQQDYRISIKVDESHQRVKTMHFSYSRPASDLEPCNNIQNFIEPITITVDHYFVEYNSTSSFCKTCPVERKGSKLKSVRALLPFDIECGDDKICNSNITAAAKFLGVRDDGTWVIGSSDVSLDLTLQNNGEPSYLSFVTFVLPEGLALRSMLPSCQDASDNDLTITCDAGNPLGRREQKTITLDLDMRHFLQEPVYNTALNFFIYIDTHGTNEGTSNITMKLYLRNDAALILNGKANEETYYFTVSNEQKLNITFQHTYQVLKFGSTPIFDAQLIVHVPTSIRGLDNLVYVYKPQLYISGTFYECSMPNITFLDIQVSDVPKHGSADEFNLTTHILNNTTALRNVTNHKTNHRNVDNPVYSALTIPIGRVFVPEEVDYPDDINMQQKPIVIECSNEHVRCSTITCDISLLKTQYDVGKLILKLVFDVTKLKEDRLKRTTVFKINTEGQVKIIQPATRIFSPKHKPEKVLITTFYNTLPERVQPWVILISVLLGLLVLCALIIILSIVGFFRRNKKEELLALRANKTDVCETS